MRADNLIWNGKSNITEAIEREGYKSHEELEEYLVNNCDNEFWSYPEIELDYLQEQWDDGEREIQVTPIKFGEELRYVEVAEVIIKESSLEKALEVAQMHNIEEFKYNHRSVRLQDYQVKAFVIVDKENDEIILFESRYKKEIAEWLGIDRSTLDRNKIGTGYYEYKNYIILKVTTIEGWCE